MRHKNRVVPDFVDFTWPKIQPSKLRVAGSNPAGVAHISKGFLNLCNTAAHSRLTGGLDAMYDFHLQHCIKHSAVMARTLLMARSFAGALPMRV
jgi:hypothetical protein